MTKALRLGILAAFGAALALPAHAEVDKAKVRKVIERAGLMGFWAQDCSKPAAPDNAWETFTVDPEGYVINGDYEGTDGESAYVVDARRLPDGKLWYKFEVTLGEPELELVYEIKGNRHRTWSSRHASGEWLIERGEWDTDQEPTQTAWFTHCPANRFPDDPTSE